MTPAEKSDPEQEERRSKGRFPADDTVSIELLAEGRRRRALVCDVSLRGMRLDLSDGCAVGSPVILEHPVAGSFRGVCIWNDGSQIGVEILEPTREIERVLQCICLLIGLPATG